MTRFGAADGEQTRCFTAKLSSSQWSSNRSIQMPELAFQNQSLWFLTWQQRVIVQWFIRHLELFNSFLNWYLQHFFSGAAFWTELTTVHQDGTSFTQLHPALAADLNPSWFFPQKSHTDTTPRSDYFRSQLSPAVRIPSAAHTDAPGGTRSYFWIVNIAAVKLIILCSVVNADGLADCSTTDTQCPLLRL